MVSGYIYVASPYSHELEVERERRYKAVSRYVAFCLVNKEPVYSPIVHNHELAKTYDLPREFSFWRSFDLTMLRYAIRLRVFMLPGWDDSKGVREEIIFAKNLELPIEYLIPEVEQQRVGYPTT